MKNKDKVLWGFVLIIIGVIIALNSLGITNIDIFFDGWWTFFIIIPCFIDLFSDEKGKMGNIIGLAIGVFLLLGVRNILPFDFITKLIVPFILVMIGLSLIFKNAWSKKINEKIIAKKKNDMESITATFSGQKVMKEEEFKGADINAVFGGVTLDLTNAKIKEEAIIDASAIFGGIVIIIPKDTNVEVKSTSIFGGVSNKVINHEKNEKTIYIEANSLFGGVDIK